MSRGVSAPDRSFNTALEELNDDRDSISVNPGSPPSPLPPLTQDHQEEQRIDNQLEEEEKSPLVEDVVSELDIKEDDEETEETPPPRESRFIIDPAGQLTHDETTVDIVTVPCPGGHPLKTWNRDGLMSRYFGAPAMRDAEVNDPERPGPSWVRQGIRREADRARILLYEHPEIKEGTTLSKLADEFLDNLRRLRRREGSQRPLIFIGHSVGGLVVKMALIKAGKNKRLEGILRQCYGVAFFGKQISFLEARLTPNLITRNASPGLKLFCHAKFSSEYSDPFATFCSVANLYD